MDELSEQRFWSKVDKSGDGCWLRTAAQARGYGRFLVAGKVRQAHHVAYELVTGEPVDARRVGHRCHNHVCVNPAHLRTTTKKQSNEHRVGPRRNISTGVRGVYRKGKHWSVVVGHHGRSIYVGTYDTIVEATAAARAKRLELFTHNDADRVPA